MKMREIPMDEVAALLAKQLPKGVFLCVGGERPNVMTVGWGGLAYYWRRNVYVAPIREQRHTYPLLQKERAFTISIPAPGTMEQEVTKAGTLSGRDGDKFGAIGLNVQQATSVSAPVVEGCAAYLECVVKATNAFTAAQTDAPIVEGSYPAHDFHVLFYGEITACYAREAE